MKKGKLGKFSQRIDELNILVELMAKERVAAYLEIGLRAGGTFRYVGTRLSPGSRMVGIELPASAWGVHPDDISKAVATIKIVEREVRQRGQLVTIIWGDSSSEAVVQNARAAGPYDMVFIDGDHSAEGVRADWLNYSPMARIVAFHDIDAANGRLTPESLARYGVPALWQEVKQRYPFAEIIGKSRGMGIGVLYMDGVERRR